MQIRPSHHLQNVPSNSAFRAPLADQAPAAALGQDKMQVQALPSQGLNPVQFSKLGPTENAPAHADLRLEITDHNGFLVMGQNDIEAKISGQIVLQRDFVMHQLEALNGLDPELRFKPPQFDSERKQYIIQGKAMNKILGVFDVGFEMRLGSRDEQLAFRMDNGLKRGIAYKVLSKQLDKLGLETRKEDKHLLLEPEFARSIEFILNKETGQAGRIEEILASPENLEFEINAEGQIQIQLHELPVRFSSDTEGPTAIRPENPDLAMLDFDVDLDYDLKPVVNLEDGDIQAHSNTETLSPLLGKTTETLKNELGTALSLKLSGMQGDITLDDGLALDLNAQLEISNAEDPQTAQITGRVQADKNKENTTVSAQNLSAKSLSGQELNAASVEVQLGEKLEVNLTDLDAEIAQGPLELKAEQVSGRIERQNNGALNLDLRGELQGEYQTEGSEKTGQFASSGRHQVQVNQNELQIDLEKLELRGEFELPQKENPDRAQDPTEKEQSENNPKQIQARVQSLDLNGKVHAPNLPIEVQLEDGQIEVQHDPETNRTEVALQGKTQIQAQGERIYGQSQIDGAHVLAESGQTQIQLEAQKTQGHFENASGKLKIDGQIEGQTHIALNSEQVQIQTHDGKFDAEVNSNERIKVKGEGGDLDLSLSLPQEDEAGNKAPQEVHLVAEDIDLSTSLDLKGNQIRTRTQGERAELDLLGQAVEIRTENTQSEIQELKIKDTILGTGTTGDVEVQVSPQNGSQDVTVKTQNAEVQAVIRNRRDSMRITADTQGDMQLEIRNRNEVRIQSENAQSDVDVQLTSPGTGEDKVNVQAQGSDFDVLVKGKDDLEIQLEDSQFKGQITPNSKVALEIESSRNADVQVSLGKEDQMTQIQIESAASIAGELRVDDKLETVFSSGQGFEVRVDESPEAGEVFTEVKDVELEGRFQTTGVNAQIQGQTDVSVRAVKRGPVHIGIEGEVNGRASIAHQAEGHLSFDGQINMALNKKDLDLSMHGPIGVAARSDKFNSTGRAYIPTGEQGLQLSVRDKQVSLDLGPEGFIELDNPAALQLNKPGVENFLQRLQSEQVRLYYSNLSMTDNGKTASVALRSSEISSDYGEVQLAVNVNKQEQLNMDSGTLEFTPDVLFYELLQNHLSDKYSIDIEGIPSFENGEIRVKGEVRTRPTGLIQLADFNIKATVEDNKLVFELDKAEVLGVVGTNTAGRWLNKVLSKTDIDVFKKSNQKIEISLADVVKDLSLTQGINFSRLRLEENQFKVDFYFDGLDQQVAKHSKNNDHDALKTLLAENDPAHISEESLAMIFNSFAASEDVETASQLLQTAVDHYLQGKNQHKWERALNWMAKSKDAIQADVEDNISIRIARNLNPLTTQGREKVRQLPKAFIAQLADNLDLTFSQSWRFNLISNEERSLANALRRIHGIPENKRVI